MPELETPQQMCSKVTQEFVMLRGHKSMGLWLTFRPKKANIHSSSTILQLHLGCIVIDVVRIRSSETSAFTEIHCINNSAQGYCFHKMTLMSALASLEIFSHLPQTLIKIL